MNTARQHKSRQKKHYSSLKAGWNKIHEIVEIRISNRIGTNEGVTSKWEWFDFLTNFRKDQLPLYKEAIRTYKGSTKFGLTEKAYGFHESRGGSFYLGDGYYALYVSNVNRNGLSDFWGHFRSLCTRKVAEEDEKNKKVRELNFRKAVYHKWYGHTEADGIALAQKLTSELPDKWKKYFKYTIVQRSDQTFDICFGPINAADPRPHAMKNLVKAYTEINYKARYFEINAIGKF